jgi:UDP-N-acetylmuramyl pentapeptide phosphotransferase/UDP-N-acetylglucosamine-1-phosphate transferase
MSKAAVSFSAGAGAIAFAAAVLISVAIIVAIRPWLQRVALAKPNARSSHSEPTPQGGGIAVVAGTIIAAGGVGYFCAAAASNTGMLVSIFAGVILIAAVGATDDMRPLGVLPRLLLQAVAVALVIYALPGELRTMPKLPWWIERALLVLGGLWFVNLVNFMDGLDWMTVAEVVPVTAALGLVGAFGFLPPAGTIISFALCALVGHHALAAAALLPLYYLADATITLLRRLANREPVWQAHRSHFYQRATDRGFTVNQVVGYVFAVNLGLAALAFATLTAPGLLSELVALVCGTALVGWLLFAFDRGRGEMTSGTRP